MVKYVTLWLVLKFTEIKFFTILKLGKSVQINLYESSSIKITTKKDKKRIILLFVNKSHNSQKWQKLWFRLVHIKLKECSHRVFLLHIDAFNLCTQPGIWLAMVLGPVETTEGIVESCIKVRVSSSWSESGIAGVSCELVCFSFSWLGSSVSTGPYCEVEPTSKSVDGFKPPNIFPHSNAYIR